MAIFNRSGEFYSVAYITGPTHTLLQLAFSTAPVSEPSVVALPVTRPVRDNALDPKQICRAVLAAAAATNSQLGTAFFPVIIRYVPDDSPDYALYGRCTDLLIRRMASGGAFESVPNLA